MTHRFAAVSSITTLALLLASACGGNSFSNHDDPQGGSGNTAGTPSNGATGNVAGKPSKGGSSSGGSVGTGGSSSMAGAGNTTSGGSAGGDACTAVPDSGNCDGYMERWYHDPTTGLCRGFIYGGCGGNDNNHQSFEECQKACPGGNPNYDACIKPTDCIVTGVGCCGICDGPDVKARDLLAYNRMYAGFVVGCGDTAPTPDPGSGAAPPGDIACAPCPELPGDSGSLKYFVPNCVRGECVVEDVRTSAVSSCQTDEECMLRNGNGCCESCGPRQLIAVSTNGSFSKLVCGDLLPPCAACEPQPGYHTALCNADGHCQVSPVAK